MTSLSLVLVLAAMWLFWTGHYGWGLAAAWGMTFLDTVDGKLARVTLNSSRFGDFFDHSIDLVHPPFWWWAWIVGLAAVGLPLTHAALALTAIVAGYVLQRLEEGLFIACFGIEMHVWERFDSRFRLITARRNPNLLLLTASLPFGRPDLGILAGLKIGWAFAWRTLIAAELVFGATSGKGGLGWYIFQNRNELYTDKVFAGLAVVILIGLLVENLVFDSLERVTVRRWGMVR